MITFFKKGRRQVIAVESDAKFDDEAISRLTWLFDGATPLKSNKVSGIWVGPRKEMITPWSTNAVEITQNMGLDSISRIEEFFRVESEDAEFDRMLNQLYKGLDADVFKVDKLPEDIIYIENLALYNDSEGLALSKEEISYLENLSKKIGRPLTDSEVFGFSQVNSEHCRHKIFNGVFCIDGKEMPSTLFKLIKKTTADNPNSVISAYKDNVAFLRGPKVNQFAPHTADKADFFEEREIETVISLKAETHNFPTTVEPFNGAATGTGGEIRDRMAGGKASLPIAGTAVYMTSYPRLDNSRQWQMNGPFARPWLYQTPEQILIKASNGASDFGNKFGQPLICGSVLTFEHEEHDRTLAYDKVIMLAGGVGFGTLKDAIKGDPEPGMEVVVMGGDNYRIGMGGGAVSSVATGQYANSIELNAVQRANPEMQKRVSNVVRAIAEMEENPCVSIHDHGAGGHLNALSELVESTGGEIRIADLPIGDKTLSAKEIVGNESQERMGLVIDGKHVELLRKIAQRERAPFYTVGRTTGDDRFVFTLPDGTKPIDLAMSDMFGNSPKTTMVDDSVNRNYAPVEYNSDNFIHYLEQVLQLEAVACKDWLTNKVDRSVTGRIARQQCQGEIQLPLSDCGVVALDYRGKSGIATSIGHAPQAALVDSSRGSILSIAEALTNLAGVHLKDGLKSISLSANWMWPCKNPGEDARLYKAVEACSKFACELGINIPTGKDSLSMTQKYGEKKVLSPGTVIISAAAEVDDIRNVISPVIKKVDSTLLYIDFSFSDFVLGGSAFAQSLNKLGDKVPTVGDSTRFKSSFEALQHLISEKYVLAQHDVSAGGLITTLLEMTFANRTGGLKIDLSDFNISDSTLLLFAENPAIVIQVDNKNLSEVTSILNLHNASWKNIGIPISERIIKVVNSKSDEISIDINKMRDLWYHTSYMLDRLQTPPELAEKRFKNYANQPLRYHFPKGWKGTMESLGLSNFDRTNTPKAAIIREKGVNGDREMAYSLYLAGFNVKDVHMTDLTSGKETLEDVNMIVFCGGFSNSDVLGSAKGWAGGFLYNEKAKKTLENFYRRSDTLSLGICNGCQLMAELNLINPEHKKAPKLLHNKSNKFESAYINIDIPENNSVMFGSLSGTRLGVWIAHGEGRFALPEKLENYNVIAKYSYKQYPANPNGSYASVAGIASADGRHLAMMPHLERAIFPWQCADYPTDRLTDRITPWLQAFVNARLWIESHV